MVRITLSGLKEHDIQAEICDALYELRLDITRCTMDANADEDHFFAKIRTEESPASSTDSLVKGRSKRVDELSISEKKECIDRKFRQTIRKTMLSIFEKHNINGGVSVRSLAAKSPVSIIPNESGQSNNIYSSNSPTAKPKIPDKKKGPSPLSLDKHENTTIVAFGKKLSSQNLKALVMESDQKHKFLDNMRRRSSIDSVANSEMESEYIISRQNTHQSLEATDFDVTADPKDRKEKTVESSD